MASLVLLGFAAVQSSGSRIVQTARHLEGSNEQNPREHKVHILLTRHGLSCANIVSEFRTDMWKKSHATMKDPLLCAAGAQFAANAKVEMETKLPELKIPQPDAVLSSVLARAMHTAFKQYPEPTPVYVVPYIRESGLGINNSNAPIEDQKVALEEGLGQAPWKVNYQYADAFGFEHTGSWEKFEHFLKTAFIPDLVRTSKKESGDSIVLAVVSHSNFMNEGVVKAACSRYYDKTLGKARNNQVVDLQYTYKDSGVAGDHDMSPVRSLVPVASAKCSPVIDGVSIRDGTGSKIKLCKSDIGEGCWDQITNQGMKSYPTLVEDDIKGMLTKLRAKQAQIGRLSGKPGAKMGKATDELNKMLVEVEESKKKQCWGGGLPDPKLYNA